VTSRPLLQFHLLLLPDHRPLQGGNRDLPIKSPTDLLVEGLALLHELGPFLGGAGGHHLDAVPQMALPVGEPRRSASSFSHSRRKPNSTSSIARWALTRRRGRGTSTGLGRRCLCQTRGHGTVYIT
jgi:hypothetical protein